MKERIINESIESLRREGLKFSIDTLAEKLNISKKTVYKYFSNKEELAFALYRKYFADAKEQAKRLAQENSLSARKQLLHLYLDAKSMTCVDIFNKYKLNEVLRSYTAKESDELLKIVFSSLGDGAFNGDEESFGIILNGTFEKLCSEKIAPDGVLNRLVNILW